MENELLHMMESNRSCLTREETADYLQNKLSEEKRYNIEHHLLDCELCESALQGYAAANISPAVTDIDAIRKQMSKANKTQKAEVKSAKIKKVSSRFNWLAVAAVFALCAAAAWLYSNKESNLYADFYQPYDKNLLATRAASTTENEALTKGLDAYQVGNFEESLLLFEEAKLKDPENSNIALYAGMASLETGAYDKSTEWLAEARINQPSAYGTATWYLAMAHLAKKDFPACRNMLKQLTPDDSPYYEQAQALFNKLEEK